LKRVGEEIKSLLSSSANVDVTRFPEVSAFQRRVFEARYPDQAAPMEDDTAPSDDDADIVISRATQSSICPISQREFEEPVRNPACGHVYSNQAIRQLVRNDTTPCPVAGCRSMVNIRSLQPDIEMEARLQRLRNRIFS
jgi:SUMO ligase MMS21 Smc5/6 complex component